MARTLLKAEWRKLMMANYVIDPAVLMPYLPFGTQLDFFENKCYVSLVGFMFLNTRLLGIKFPFHTNFEEVNLRFYVTYKSEEGIKRGVVFIKEIVSKHMLAIVANNLYHEKYERMPMRNQWIETAQNHSVRYEWQKGRWHSMSMTAAHEKTDILPGSEEEFITEHYWGYNMVNKNLSTEYAVEHPRWSVYKPIDHRIDVDFGMTYGDDFRFLNDLNPASVFLADGSDVIIKEGFRLTDY